MKNDSRTRKRRKGGHATSTTTKGNHAEAALSNEAAAETVVVGLGASAGGLEALEQFFQNMPSDSGMAFVVITHLDPNHRSVLGDIIGRYTKMEVRTIEEGIPVRPNHAYIIPSEQFVYIRDNELHLVSRTELRGTKMPIDLFFRSLAEAKRDKSVAIIFSGTGTDGSLGIKDIKEQFGLVMAQDLISSKYDGMPRSAVDTGLVDYVLSPSEMPSQILKYFSLKPAEKERSKEMENTYPDGIHRILALIRAQTGNDFSSYKKKTIVRRVERRMGILSLKDYSSYIGHLRTNPNEVELLQKDLLISVTRFFRDPEAFAALKDIIQNDLFPGKEKEPVLRVWVPACATGEEVYSIAIVLQECLDETKRKIDVQIFGTDIDPEAIDRARTGMYLDNIISDVGAERLSKFFVFEKNYYRVKKSIREMVVFATHNLLKDPPFSKIDLISCRNLLIYLEPKAQQRIASTFAYVANPGGLLFLGASESLSPFLEFFKPLDDKWRIAERMKYPVPAWVSTTSAPEAQIRGSKRISRRTIGELTGPDWQGAVPGVERFLLDRLAPPTVIVNASGDVVYIHGDTGKYLRPAIGSASNNISAMARKDIRAYLTSAILRANKEGNETVLRDIKLDVYGHAELVDIKVIPTNNQDGIEGLFAVVFEESRPPQQGKRTKKDQLVQECESLKNQLGDIEKQLNAATTELEASREENKSLSEEMESTNEEFQSTSEELETSREELQSVNEELLTVNNELQKRIENLAEVNNDLRNLLNNTEIATIFLDTKLMVRRFTEPAKKFINLVQSDIGRPLAAFSTSLQDIDLTAKAQEVVDTLRSEEHEVRTKDGTWYLMRSLPYRTEENTPDGVVMTFLNITSRKRDEENIHTAAEHVKKKAQRLEAILESLGEGLLEVDLSGKVIYANPTALRQFDIKSVGDFGSAIDDFERLIDLSTLDGKPVPQDEWPLRKAIRGESFFDHEYEVTKKGAQIKFTGSFNGTPIEDQQGNVMSAIVTVRDTSTDNKSMVGTSENVKQQGKRMTDPEPRGAHDR